MALTFQVNGEAKVQTGTGAAGALQDFAISMDGVTITLIPKFEDVFIDTFGQQVPFDVQYFLAEARITAKCLYWDETVLEKFRNIFTDTAEGTVAQAGRLIGAAGANVGFIGLFVTSPSLSLPWRFPKSYLIDNQDLKVGTRRGELQLTWRALPYSGTLGSTAGTVLFQHS